MLAIARLESIAPRRTYNPNSPALAPELGRAFAACFDHPTADGDARLREITTALVQRLKGDGLTPERVLVAIKSALTRYAHLSTYPSLWNAGVEAPDPAHELYKRLFDWMLDAYFAKANV